MTKLKKDDDYFKLLELLTKGLFNIVFRGGPIEEYHVNGNPIGDKEMEVLNRYGFNCLGYMLDLLLSGELESFQKLCINNSKFVSYFDPLDMKSNEVQKLEQLLKLIKNKNDR